MNMCNDTRQICQNSEAHAVDESEHANRFVPSFLELFAPENGPSNTEPSPIQIVRDGTQLNAEALMTGDKLDISRPILVEDTPESIGMTVFRPSPVRNQIEDSVTVRSVADVIGHHYPVRVLNVEHQEELQGWTMGDLVEFFEDKDRLRRMSRCQLRQSSGDCDASPSNQDQHKVETENMGRRTKRKAALKATNTLMKEQDRPKALNQLSLEFSETPLRKLVESPSFVRGLDWIDNAWPRELRDQKQSYPSVQYYCLTSTAGCYTDFHVDFGGTAVWYHVLSGAKKFVLIAPTPQNLAVYEKWLNHPNQESLFLPHMIPNREGVIVATLQPAQTLLIPTAWIHGVYTPEDSVVLGGNFLHGLDLPLQLQINAIEDRTHVNYKFRFPFFKRLHFYVGGMYLEKLKQRAYVPLRVLENLSELIDALESWYSEALTNCDQTELILETAQYVAEKAEYFSVEEFLQALRHEQDIAMRIGQKGKAPSPKLGLFTKMEGSGLLSGETVASSAQSPRLRLKLGQRSPRDVATPDQGEDGGLRIVISQNAKELHRPLPTSVISIEKKEVREDTEYVDSVHEDNDWVPSSFVRTKAGSSPGQKKHDPTAKGRTVPLKRQSTENQVNNYTRGARQTKQPAAKKPKTTARQRLLKKFG